MNRRGFLSGLAAVAATFAVLPSAVTYQRTWRIPPRKQLYVPNPAYYDAPYEIYAPGLEIKYDRTIYPFYAKAVDKKLLARSRNPATITDLIGGREVFPTRFVSENGVWVAVPPFILAES